MLFFSRSSISNSNKGPDTAIFLFGANRNNLDRLTSTGRFHSSKLLVGFSMVVTAGIEMLAIFKRSAFYVQDKGFFGKIYLKYEYFE